jgi:hypothetical protein
VSFLLFSVSTNGALARRLAKLSGVPSCERYGARQALRTRVGDDWGHLATLALAAEALGGLGSSPSVRGGQELVGAAAIYQVLQGS